MVDEEASLEWDGFLGPVTWTLLIPSRTFRINILSFAVIAATVSFLSSMILRYQVIDSFFSSGGVTVTVFLMSWMTVFISLQSLLVHPPPETATWRHMDNPEVQAVVRPNHPHIVPTRHLCRYLLLECFLHRQHLLHCPSSPPHWLALGGSSSA